MSPIYNERANPKRAKYEITGVQSTWFRIGQPYICLGRPDLLSYRQVTEPKQVATSFSPDI